MFKAPISPISDVHLRKVFDVGQENIHFDDVIQVRTSRLKDCLEVCDALMLGKFNDVSATD